MDSKTKETHLKYFLNTTKETYPLPQIDYALDTVTGLILKAGYGKWELI